MKKRRKVALHFLINNKFNILFSVCCTISLLFSQNLNSQTWNYGIGFTTNVGWLANEVQSSLGDFSFDDKPSLRVGLNLFTEFSTPSAFQLRINAHIHTKEINTEISQPFRGFATFTEKIGYIFSAYDISVTSLYDIRPNKQSWKIKPILGWTLGISKLQRIDYIRSTGVKSNGNSAAVLVVLPQDLPQRNLEATYKNRSSFLYTALQTGINIQPPLRLLHRQVEFNTTFHYSPRTFLENLITLAPFEVEGKYHFVSVGMNLFLNKSEK
ncbi:MAG: hypothetical protein HC892_11430 [Saprospiraceae bacterium]|nr:hypothetical protein [Saprospiraceae bacterium]